jgi:DNA (cytosine-5)-methyltransferase 1
MIYLNEFDKHAAAWLRELIREGVLPPGEVDERDIREVRATDLLGFTQCHFFAGIGGWCEALRLAGWPADRPVWTGSCPCQPYSSAGKGLGDADPRNLWPDFFRLIRECRPECVFGEQVEGAVRHGWLDGISADLEGEGYAVGSVVLGAHSGSAQEERWVCYDDGAGHVDYLRERITVSAPHIRQRLYWVADAGSFGRERRAGVEGDRRDAAERGEAGGDSGDGGESVARGVFHPTGDRRGEGRAEPVGRGVAGGRGPDGVAHADGAGQRPVGGGVPEQQGGDDAGRGRAAGALGDPIGGGVRGGGHGADGAAAGGVQGADGERERVRADAGATGGGNRAAGVAQGDTGSTGREGGAERGIQRGQPAHPGGGFWGRYELIPCRDGKARRTQPGLFPLAHGVSGRVAVVRPGQPGRPADAEEVRWVNRVGALKGAGNAIVPQVAAEFVTAFLEVTEDVV